MKKVLKRILAVFFLALSIFLFVVVKQIDVLPTKYFYLFVGVILFINLIGALTLFSKKKWTKVFTVLSYTILLIVSLLGSSYGLNTLDFLNKSFNNNKVEVSTYNVVVLKTSSVKKIDGLKDKTIGYLGNDSNKDEVLKNINSKVTANLKEYEDLYELYDILFDKKIDSIVLNVAYLDELIDEANDKYENLRVIYSFDIEEEIEVNEDNGKLKPMNIYLSGSDSRSKTIQNKSRSDVNMVLTINPNTKTVLMTSIPRDYYVQVHGQKGLKDKLTHAGIYGIDKSRQTVEDLFDIDIAYSIKIGMPAVEEVVDLVGGVDIVSDVAFNSSHIKGWHVKKGVNHMNGKQALAYSRERYAYASGDRHRILNQQQVLEAVLNKAMKDKTILTKYDKLLSSLSNLYRTDIPKNIITDLVKMQINDMSGWTFISNSVSGSDASSPTYTAPNSKRYVMIPYEKDVKNAHDKIEAVLKGTNK